MTLLRTIGGALTLINKLVEGVTALVREKRKADARKTYSNILDAARDSMCDKDSDKPGADTEG